MRRFMTVRPLLLLACVIVVGCRKNGPSDPPPTTYVVTITSTGVSPTGIDVPLGSRVAFVNNDSRQHYIHSDPHPDATDCPALNSVGLLSVGQRRETGNMVDANKVCGYHDHDAPTNAIFKGTVTAK